MKVKSIKGKSREEIIIVIEGSMATGFKRTVAIVIVGH